MLKQPERKGDYGELRFRAVTILDVAQIPGILATITDFPDSLKKALNT